MPPPGNRLRHGSETYGESLHRGFRMGAARQPHFQIIRNQRMKTLKSWQRAKAGDLVWIRSSYDGELYFRSAVTDNEIGKSLSRIAYEHRAEIQITRESDSMRPIRILATIAIIVGIVHLITRCIGV